MSATESTRWQDSGIEGQDRFELPDLDSTDFNAMMQDIEQHNPAFPMVDVATTMNLNEMEDIKASNLEINITPRPQAALTAPQKPETCSPDKDSRVIVDKGYPSCETSIPAGASLKAICKYYPNHLIGENLNQFLGIMTAGDIFNLMPKGARDKSRAKGPKFNLIQKRLTTQRKKLEASGTLNQQYEKNYAREKASLDSGPEDNEYDEESDEKASKRRKNLAKLERLIQEDKAMGTLGRSRSRAKTEESSSENAEEEPETHNNHKDDTIERDDEESTTATTRERGEISEVVRIDTLIGVDQPITPLNPQQAAARRSLMEKRANLRNFLETVDEDEVLVPLTDSEVSAQYDQQIQTETLYQFHMLLRDIVDIDPRTKNKTDAEKEHVRRRMWLDTFGQWAFHFRDGHDQPRGAAMPGLLSFTCVLKHQRQVIEEAHIIALNSLPGGAPELPGSKLIRNVLKEQANIVRSFSTNWERMLLDLKRGTQNPRGDQGGQQGKFDFAMENRTSDQDQARIAVIRDQLPAFPLLPPTPSFYDPPFKHVEGKSLFKE